MDDNIDISTGSLNFGAKTRQMLNLWSANYGIGVHGTDMRTDSAFHWYKGGKHADDPTSPDNGTLQLEVDGSGNLNTTADINIPGNVDFVREGTPDVEFVERQLRDRHTGFHSLLPHGQRLLLVPARSST